MEFVLYVYLCILMLLHTSRFTSKIGHHPIIAFESDTSDTKATSVA